MKNLSTLILLYLLLSTTVFGQPKPVLKPLIIRGQLTNSPEKILNIFFTDENDKRILDTIRLDSEGRFYLKTYKIKGPQLTSIQQKTTQINGIFVAPGYDLIITGDATDFKTLFKTTKIDGIGAESNRFRTMLNARVAQHAKPWYELNEQELVAFAKRDRKMQDSLVHAAYDPYLAAAGTKSKDRSAGPSLVSHDPYVGYFKKMLLMNNQFMEIYYLLTKVNTGKYTYAEAKALIDNNIDHQLLNNMVKDEYLISEDYKTWLVGSEYTNYLIKLDYLRDSTLRQKKGYRLIKMDQVYTGKVKDYVLYHQMSGEITYAKNFDRLNSSKDLFKPYIAELKNPAYQSALNDLFKTKEAELLRTGLGKPAPAFTLESSTGTLHSLADFKGKVIFIDLWASWCGPCRAETPHLAALYDKYKSDNRIAFVSIAVSDGKKEWQQAVEKDKPEWLQLLDKDDLVRKSYVANMIPQFIIVDKNGSIVNFNAPEPSSGKKLEDLLVKEMSN